jgi:hypothetical protein
MLSSFRERVCPMSLRPVRIVVCVTKEISGAV